MAQKSALVSRFPVLRVSVCARPSLSATPVADAVSVAALGNLATILASQGRLEQAERAYRAALSVRGNMADVHYNL